MQNWWHLILAAVVPTPLARNRKAKFGVEYAVILAYGRDRLFGIPPLVLTPIKAQTQHPIASTRCAGWFADEGILIPKASVICWGCGIRQCGIRQPEHNPTRKGVSEGTVPQQIFEDPVDSK